MRLDPGELREEYGLGGLERATSSPDPLELFADWLEQAIDAGLREPNAMTLATAALSGQPSARVVLLKAFDERGFVFATNYDSRKAGELETNPRAGLVFCWLRLERQVRIEGTVSRCTAAESDRIHEARPRAAQLGAWASRQSSEIADRATLEARFRDFERRFPAAVPRPPHWGGYRLAARSIEFWQGRPHRLHDRFLYTRAENGAWSRRRLAP